MSTHTLTTVDSLLGYVEYGGLLVVLVLLIRLRRMGPRATRGALALMVALALTVCQPFGVTSHAVSRSALPRNAKPIAVDQGHRISVAGLALFSFQAYTRKYSAFLGETPTFALKVRSWVVPIVLTHATRVLRMCESDNPCWVPGVRYLGRRPSSLSLWQAPDGTYFYVLRGGEVPLHPDLVQVRVYRLGVGLASVTGVVYWFVLICLLCFRLTKHRREHHVVGTSEDRGTRGRAGAVALWEHP